MKIPEFCPNCGNKTITNLGNKTDTGAVIYIVVENKSEVTYLSSCNRFTCLTCQATTIIEIDDTYDEQE